MTDSSAIWAACDEGRFVGYALASSITDIFSIARRAVDLPIARQTLEQAATLPGSDFEDNVQLAGASIAGLDALVTCNPCDFVAAALPILTPAVLLAPL